MRQLGPLLGCDGRDRFRQWRVDKSIPLIIRLPHGARAGTVATAGGHLDVAPTILGLLASGATEKEVLADYPDLQADDLKACVAYAAWLTCEREIELQPG